MPGIFSLMLHSHIPYCRKSGVWPAGEEWLFEAMNETYIPLLKTLRSLYYDGIRPRTMIGMVPILMEQLADEYMLDRFCEYMEDKIRRARDDLDRFGFDPARQKVARYWLKRFENNYSAFVSDFHRDILGTLKWLQDEYVIEVVTSAATHGFLPLLEQDSAVFAQIRIGIDTYRRYFGRSPRGFWLPECAYRPEQFSDRDKRMRKGIDEWLSGEGIEYFFIESAGISQATFVKNLYQEARPTLFRGYKLPSGVCVFGRNEATGKQVWSPDTGYPGDPYYLEFHQKDPESGLHYTRVTGHDTKQVYDPEKASQRVKEHARHFAGLLVDIIDHAGTGVSEPVIVAPYDCELFGHWWHEGVEWLEYVYRRLAAEDTLALRSLSEYLDQHRDDLSTITMEPSTWGLNSDYTVWLNPEHGWIWPYINSCSVKMEEVLSRGSPSDERGERIMRQLARELLLMQGSDWPFLLFTTQAKEYANKRFHNHHQRFQKLIWAAVDLGDHERLSEKELERMEDVDCPWQDIDYNLFSRRKQQIKDKSSGSAEDISND